MYVNATWVVDEIASKYPEAVENIGAFVLPLYEDTENYTDSSLPGAIGITTACKDVEAAKRAVDFISSSKAQQIYADAQPGIYLNKNVKAELSPAHQDLVDVMQAGKAMALWQGTVPMTSMYRIIMSGAKPSSRCLRPWMRRPQRMRLLQTTPTGPNKAAFGMGCGRRSSYPIFF